MTTTKLMAVAKGLGRLVYRRVDTTAQVVQRI
jgi:hypothetical protein